MMSPVVCGVTPFSLMTAYQRLCLPLAYLAYSSFLSTFIRNIAELLPDYTASDRLDHHTRRFHVATPQNGAQATSRKRALAFSPAAVQVSYTGCENRSEIYRARIVTKKSRLHINSPCTSRQITFNNFIFVLLSSVYLTEQSGTRILSRRLTTAMG